MSAVITPRKYQADGLAEVEQQWSAGATNCLFVAPTGAGKTFYKAFMAQRFVNRGELVVVFAHRDVLLSQISLSFAKVGIPHRFICSKATEREIGDLHISEFGRSFISENSVVIVASVMTWIKRDISAIAPYVKLWLLDESHHLTPDSSWGKCIEPLVNAKGLGVTATPIRNDGKGLSRECGGVFDGMVLAPTMGELIEMGSLSPYRIYTVPSELDHLNMKTTKSGDYNQKKLAAVTEEADITGDAVEHYLSLANGKQTITFCVNIEHSEHVAKQFNDAGVRSVALSSKTHLLIRQKRIREFKKGLIKNLVNCDLFSEGFDVPSVECVIMLRKTASYSLFKQQFGRALRVIETKPYGILIDHVGNVRTHCIYGAPHDDPDWTETECWSLEVRGKKKKKSTDDDDKSIARTCPECFAYYIPKSNKPDDYICPYCFHAETPDETNAAQRELQIREGTLVEYDSGYITGLINKRQDVDQPFEKIQQKMKYSGAPSVVVNSAVNNHIKRKEAQRQLRDSIQKWCERSASANKFTVETTQNEFKRIFGIDVFQAQVLGERKAYELRDKINSKIT